MEYNYNIPPFTHAIFDIELGMRHYKGKIKSTLKWPVANHSMWYLPTRFEDWEISIGVTELPPSDIWPVYIIISHWHSLQKKVYEFYFPSYDTELTLEKAVLFANKIIPYLLKTQIPLYGSAQES